MTSPTTGPVTGPGGTVSRVRTPVLDVAYEEYGDPAGPPVVLLHGFPYDVRSFDGVAALLPQARVVVPYLRGYGGTRFLDDATLRSGQQGALGQDLLELLDALGIGRAVVGGYDWGGRAACVVSALWPERVAGLVTVAGYNVQDIAGSAEPAPPEVEATYWYQYYLHSERGRAGLARHRDDLCRLLWRLWSPTWAEAGTAYAASAASLDNPDFVDVVVHSYRHRYGLVDGDPRYAEVEERLARTPPIDVPTVVLESGADGVGGPMSAGDLDHFTLLVDHRRVEGVGHDLPQEAPEAFAEAVRDLLAPAGSGA